MSEANRHAQSKDPCTPICARRPRGVLSALSEQRIGKGHEFTRVTSALLVWVGHSCPTPLTLILTLILRSAPGPCNTVEERTLQRRVKRSNEEPGFSR
jgi:hypothetical protein